MVRPREPIASLPDLSEGVAPDANWDTWFVDARLNFALALDSQPFSDRRAFRSYRTRRG